MAGRGKRKGSGLTGQELKAFRSKVAKLKSKGIVSKRVDARSQAATKYMRSKVRKFSDVLEGTAVAVKAKPDVRKRYVEAGIFEERGSRLIVPKEHANQRASIKKGKYVTRTREIPQGAGRRPIKEERLTLPINAKSMSGILAGLEEHGDEIDRGLKGDEQLIFRIFGHNAGISFPGIEGRDGLAAYFHNRYQHLLKETAKGNPTRANKAAGKEFELWSFTGGIAPRAPEVGKQYSKPGEGRSPKVKRVDAKGRNTMRRKMTEEYRQYVGEQKAAKDRKRYDSMSDAKKEKRKQQMRDYDARRRAKKKGK